MSAGLSLIDSRIEPQPGAVPLISTPSTLGERFHADWAAARTEDTYWNITAARQKEAQYIIDDIHALNGKKIENPYDNPVSRGQMEDEPGAAQAQYQAERMKILREEAAKAKEGLDPSVTPPGFLDVDGIDDRIAQRSGATRAEAERLYGTGGGAGAFLGATAAGMVTPHGVASLFLPIGGPAAGLEGAIARTATEGFLAGVGKEAIYQGLGQMAGQTVGTLADYGVRKQLGTEPSGEEMLGEILQAGAGGAVLGGGLHAAGRGLRMLAGRGAVELPRAVKDEAIAAESEALYGNKNPLGIPVAEHQAAVDRSVGEVALGRPISEAPVPTIHDTVRASNPELMERYDQLAATQQEIRAQLAPDDATIARLKQKADAADAAIAAAGPQTQETGEQMARQARLAHEIHDDAVARKAAMEAGQAPSAGAPAQPSSTGLGELGGAAKAMTANLYEGLYGALQKGETRFAGIEDPVLKAARADFEAGRIKSAEDLADFVNKRGAFAAAPAETTISRSLRQQLMATDQQMRDMLQEIRAAYKAPDQQMAQFFKPEAKVDEPRLTPEELTRVAELRENVSDYERLMGEAKPEDKPAWQSAIDAAHSEIDQIIGGPPDLPKVLKEAVENAAKPPSDLPGLEPSATMQAPEPVKAARPEEAKPGKAATPQDRAREAEVREALSEEGRASEADRRAMEDIEQQEKEVRTAAGCVGGAI